MCRMIAYNTAKKAEKRIERRRERRYLTTPPQPKHKGKELSFVRTGDDSRPFNISEAVNYRDERRR